jgi:hypothetical protein
MSSSALYIPIFDSVKAVQREMVGNGGPEVHQMGSE